MVSLLLVVFQILTRRCRWGSPKFSCWGRSNSKFSTYVGQIHHIGLAANHSDPASAHESWQALSELGELIEPQSKCRKDFIEECKNGKMDGVLVTFRTFNSIQITGLFDEELVQLLPESLKYICHNGQSFGQFRRTVEIFRIVWRLDL